MVLRVNLGFRPSSLANTLWARVAVLLGGEDFPLAECMLTGKGTLAPACQMGTGQAADSVVKISF